MDKKAAAILLASLLERIERDGTIGSVSSLERRALQQALEALGQDPPEPETAPAPVPPPLKPNGEIVLSPTPASEAPTARPRPLPKVKLVLDSLENSKPSNPQVLMCLDFGTAMSKAFAAVLPDEYLELELGVAAGRQGYALPSSVFIGDNGKAYFGFEAVDLSQELVDSGRERLDSIKEWLSLRHEGDLDGEACVLPKALNPTDYRLTEGDLIRIYLAYLTDIACNSLGEFEVDKQRVGRYVKRRFARPCWPNAAQSQWAETLMRTMLAEAQILADTFSGRWSGGLDVAEIKGAVEQVRELGRRPDFLVAEGVPEPVAVASGAIADAHNLRDAFMVVDVGAGTTDFGLFVSTRMTDDAEDLPRVFQIPGSIHGLMQAGNRVDGMLRGFIAKRESVDATDTSGRRIMADLGRRIRSMKEVLFTTGSLEYALPNGTVGQITQGEFVADDTVQRFAHLIEDGFRKALQSVDDSWLRWLAMEGVRLHVVLTGGSSSLPMMQALAKGPIEVKGFRIMRTPVDPKPEWMERASTGLAGMYPQLAVAIGGTAESLPETATAPPVFAGGPGRTRWVAGRLQISGS